MAAPPLPNLQRAASISGGGGGGNNNNNNNAGYYIPPASDAPLKLFAGNSNPHLANEVAMHLGMQLGRANVTRFVDGECQIQILDNVRGKDVFVVQSLAPPVNESLMELLLLVTTLRRASASKITAVIPYFGYTRHARLGDDFSGSVPIAAADVANMLVVAGVDRVVVVDVHHTQCNGFFGRTPVDDLDVSSIAATYFLNKSLRCPVIVAPDHDAVGRAKRFRDEMIRLGVTDAGLAVVVDQRRKSTKREVVQQNVAQDETWLTANFDLVGDVRGKDCIIRDDIAESGWRVVHAAERLKKAGAARVFAFSTHALLTPEALGRINSSPLLELVCSNSLQLKSAEDKVQQLSIAKLLAETIRRIHESQSVSAMFKEEQNS